MLIEKKTQGTLWYKLLLLCINALVVHAAGDDELSTGLHVITRGGKFFIYPVGAGLGYRKRVIGQIQYVRELNSDGDPIEAHVFNQMNRQVFTVDDAVANDPSLGDGITSSSISLETELKRRQNGQQITVGKVGLEMHIIETGGLLNVNVDDTFNLTRNDIKFTLALSDWNFCEPNANPCPTIGNQPSGETGQFVEVGLLVTAPGGRTGSRLGPEEVVGDDDSIKYSLDDSDELFVEMAKGVVVDGSATQLLEGYPQLTSGPGQSLIVLRFNKFDSSILYDPTINYSDALPLPFCALTDGEQPCTEIFGRPNGGGDDDDNGQNPKPPRVRPWRTAIHVLGRSGQFTLFNEARDRFNDNPVFIAGVDFVREISSDGATVVGRQGPVKHNFETFANQDFEIVRQNTSDVYGLEAEETIFVTTLFSGDVEIGTLQLDTFVFTENGTIVTDGGEEFDINEDDVKFNVELKNWMFCTNATCDDEAEYVDVGVMVKGRGLPQRTRFNDTDIVVVKPLPRYNIGGNVSVVLSTKILVDGTWVDMAEGFPKLIERGGKDIFVFRFPLFNEDAMYDPQVDLSEAVEELILEENGGLDDASGDDDTSGSLTMSRLVLLHAMTLFWGLSWALQ